MLSIGEAYAFTLKWLEDNQLESSELAREVYIDGPRNKQDEADYLTEIQFPVK